MSNVVPVCTHVKTDGVRCGSPAVSGTEHCYHHSAVKTALAKGRANGKAHEGGFAPIPFLFPEDRASMQINFFLLLQAFNEQRIDQRTYRLMLSMLKAMAKNLGRTGSLIDEPSDQRSAVSDQEDGNRRQATGNSGGHVARSETSAVSLSAAWDTLLPSTIAPENCFSKKPSRPTRESNRDVFGASALMTAGQRGLNRCYISPSVAGALTAF